MSNISKLNSDEYNYVQDTQPTSPEIGERWADTSSETPVIYLYADVGSGSEWVRTDSEDTISQNLDTTVSSRATPTDSPDPASYTTTRADKLDNLDNLDVAISELDIDNRLVRHDIRFVREMSRLFFDRSMDDLNFTNGVYDQFFDTNELNFSSPSPVINTGADGYLSVGNAAFDPTLASRNRTRNLSNELSNPCSVDWDATGESLLVSDTSERIRQFGVKNAYDTSSIYTNDYRNLSNISYADESTFSNDGKWLHIIDNNNDRIYEYRLNTRWDINSVDYRRYHNIGSQNGSPDGIAWADGGSTLYTFNSSTYYKYSCPYNYQIRSINYQGNGSMPNGASQIGWSDDGLDAFVPYHDGDEFHHWKLTNPYDLSTASRVTNDIRPRYKNGNMNISAGDIIDDSRFILTTENDEIFIIKTENPWDFESPFKVISYIDINSDTNLSPSTIQGVAISDDGHNVMFNCTNERIYQLYLGKPFELESAATNNSKYRNVSGNIEETQWNHDGSAVIAVDRNNDNIVSSPVDKNYSLEGFSAIENSLDTTDFETSLTNAEFNDTGDRLYTIGRNQDTITQFDLTTPYDLSSITDPDENSYKIEYTDVRGFSLDDTGTRLLIYQDENIISYTLSTAYDFTTATYEGYVNLKSYDDYITDARFSNDGGKLYISGRSGNNVPSDHVSEFALSTAYDVTTASYTTSLNVNNYESNPYGFDFGNNGTVLVVTGTSNDQITQYNLSTAYDLSTASYYSRTSTVNHNGYSVRFNNDGSKIYVCDGQVHQFNLSTPYNVSSISDNGVTSNTNYNIRDVEFVSSSQAIVFDRNDHQLHKMSMSNWDVSTFGHGSGSSLYVGSEESNPYGFAFSSDGTYLYVIGSSSDRVYRYSMSTKWDVTTALQSQSYSVSGQESSPHDITFKPDGTRMYVVGTSSDDVFEYGLSVAWDISTASLINQNQNITGNPEAIDFRPDGKRMYISRNDDVYEYELTTAWDTSTISQVDRNNQIAYGNIRFKWVNDGKNAVVSGENQEYVHVLRANTAYDINSVSYSNGVYVGDVASNPSSVAFSSDGTKMYVTDLGSDEIHEYALSTAHDITTATYTDKSFDVSNQETNPYSIVFGNSGETLLVLGNNSDRIHHYWLATPWDITTAQYTEKNYYVGSHENSPRSMSWSADGTSFVMTGTSSDNLNEYQITQRDRSGSTFSKTTNLQFVPTKVIISHETYGDIAVDYEISDSSGNVVTVPNAQVDTEVDTTALKDGIVTITGAVSSDNLIRDNRLQSFAAYFD